MSDAAPADEAGRGRGILLVIGSALGFSMAAAFAKTIGPALPVVEVVFFRNVFALLALAPLAMQQGGIGVLRTRNPLGHVVRAGFGIVGMLASFYGYVHLPIATVTALGFAMPLFLTVLSFLLLGERVRWRRGLAVIAGFGGVLLMVRPGAPSMQGDLLASGLVVLGALTWAICMITVRWMGGKGEQGVTIVLWFAIGSALVTGMLSVPVWVTPSPAQWGMLAAIGLLSAIAQLMVTAAYRRGETTLLAPFEYSAIIWTTALGVAVWGEFPDGWDIGGIAVLVGAGMYIWHREVQLGIRR